jgi:hypothetical protein
MDTIQDRMLLSGRYSAGTYKEGVCVAASSLSLVLLPLPPGTGTEFCEIEK